MISLRSVRQGTCVSLTRRAVAARTFCSSESFPLPPSSCVVLIFTPLPHSSPTFLLCGSVFHSSPSLLSLTPLPPPFPRYFIFLQILCLESHILVSHSPIFSHSHIHIHQFPYPPIPISTLSHSHVCALSHSHIVSPLIPCSSKTSISQLFAVMRQWVPQTQRNMSSLSREVNITIENPVEY